MHCIRNRRLLLTLLSFCILFHLQAQGKKDTSKINALLETAIGVEAVFPDSAMHLAQQALKLSQSAKYRIGEAKAYTRIGSIYSTKGLSAKAIAYFKTALKLRDQEKAYMSAANSCIALSNAYTELGKSDSTFYFLFEALRYNQLTKDWMAMADTYLALGNANEQYGNAEKALGYYLKSEQISRDNKYTQGLEMSYSGLGFHYYTQGDVAKALSYFLQAEEILRTTDLAIDRARNLNNIATCYEQLKNYSKAKELYFQTLHEYEKLGMKNDYGLCLSNIGNFFNNQNQPDSAILYLKKAVQVSREIDDLPQVAIALQRLSKAYYVKEDYKTAFDYNVQYSNLNDSLLNNEKIASISDMETKYETELKEQQIVLLDAQNKTKSAQRNIFIIASLLLLLLAIAVIVGLVKTKKEKKISEALLLNILPAEVADELKQNGSAEAQFFDEVTVLFTDFKNFTQIAERLNPSELVNLLHSCFKTFDEIVTKHNVEKIKTIGDSYMCAGGLPVPNKSRAIDVVRAGLEIQEYMESLAAQFTSKGQEPVVMRLGIHTGPVVAGIVGVKKFAYDIWGDTVNTASRMESSGEPGKVNISEYTYNLIKHEPEFHFAARGKIHTKGKGEMEMYFVSRA